MSIKEIMENSKFWFLPGLMLIASVVGLFDLHAELQNREPIRVEGSFSTSTPVAIESVPQSGGNAASTTKKTTKKVTKKPKTSKKKAPKKPKKV